MAETDIYPESGGAEPGDWLTQFLTDIGKAPLLTPAEEIALAKRVERGDLQAKTRMVEANLRLVVFLAKRYRGLGLPLSDLVQEGTVGLIRAVEKFDYRRGIKFGSYAGIWIRQAIQRGLQEKTQAVHVPVGVQRTARRVQRARERLRAQLGREPSIRESADHLKLSRGEVQRVLASDYQVLSIDITTERRGEAVSLLDVLADREQLNVADGCLEGELREAVGDALDGLGPVEREVVELRYGLAGAQEASLAQTGKRLGLSSEVVRRLEDRALKQLSRSPAIAGWAPGTPR